MLRILSRCGKILLIMLSISHLNITVVWGDIMKKLFCVILTLCFVLCSGCGEMLKNVSDSYKNVQDRIQMDNREDEIEYEEIASLLELRDHVIQQVEADKLEFSFLYSGTEKLDPGMIAQMAGACFVRSVQEGDVYHITLSEFPGTRIVDAYFSEDTSSLSRDEIRVLEKAVEMVETAKEGAKTDWELELAIHDLLAECITYSDAAIYYDDPADQPRHLSVIGALLDGEANCQGYTDAFYTLASIAGFTVERQSVETDTDPHMVNLIKLDALWYVVDLTYDDSNDEAVSYHLFNAGLDMIGQEYYWAEEVERCPVTLHSDENNYYIRNELCFDDLVELSDYIAAQWADEGESVIQVMLQGENDSAKLNEILPIALETKGRSYQYSLWHSTNGYDSFYTVVFS